MKASYVQVQALQTMTEPPSKLTDRTNNRHTDQTITGSLAAHVRQGIVNALNEYANHSCLQLNMGNLK